MADEKRPNGVLREVLTTEQQIAAAENMIGESGGVLIWVRRDEGLPRAAVRAGNDSNGEFPSIEETVWLFACMDHARAMLLSQIADRYGIGAIELHGMIGMAGAIIDKKTSDGVFTVNAHFRGEGEPDHG